MKIVEVTKLIGINQVRGKDLLRREKTYITNVVGLKVGDFGAISGEVLVHKIKRTVPTLVTL